MSLDILAVKNITMRFSGLIALEKVSFSVKKLSITALIGPNGAGKTTLFNCLTGFYAPTAGELLFFPDHAMVNLRELTAPKLQWQQLYQPHKLLRTFYYKWLGGSHLIARQGIARTFQNIRLFREMTVIENLLVAQQSHPSFLSGLFNTFNYQQWEKQALEQSYFWLEQFNLNQEANQLAGTLPYGKQRHLEIARAMCTQPKLLCLDEPAAGLNHYETAQLSEIILKLQQAHQVSILLIEHDMSLVMKISNEIVVLDYGKVICSGSPDVVSQDPRVIEAYLGIEHD